MSQQLLHKPERAGILLALDLGTQLGFALGGRIKAGECILRSGRASFPDQASHPGRRWLRLWSHLDSLYEAGRPEAIILEDFVGGLRRGSSGKAFTTRAPIVYGSLRAIVEAWACHRDIGTRVVNPTRLKKAVTGHGRADKDMMRRAAAVRWKLPLETLTDDNHADALCLLGAWIDGVV
jgi:Holliday junction resolvasome RuvABC endonuclease subunit